MGVGISINVAASVKPPRKQHSDARPVDVWEPFRVDQVPGRGRSGRVGRRVAADTLRTPPLRRMGLRWDAVDLDRGEIVVQAGGSCSMATGPRLMIPLQLPTGPSRWRRCTRARGTHPHADGPPRG
jgi:hypothetical protein